MPTKAVAPKGKSPAVNGKTTAAKGKPALKSPARKKATKADPIASLRDLIQKSLDDDKAEDIVSFDLVGKSSLTDYMIIASGKSARQVAAMAEHLRDKIEAMGKNIHVEGLPNGDWVLVDTGDIVVHLFRPEVRAFYQLENLWSPER